MSKNRPSFRSPCPHQALLDAVPIAKARGIIRQTMSRPERIYDISIISKIPITGGNQSRVGFRMAQGLLAGP